MPKPPFSIKSRILSRLSAADKALLRPDAANGTYRQPETLELA